MIDPDFDPLLELQRHRNDISNLYKNLHELAKAFNAQGNLIQQLIQSMAEMEKTMIKHHTYDELMQALDDSMRKK